MRGSLGNIPKSVAVTRHVTGTKEEAVQSPREMQEACLRGKKNPTPVATKTPSRHSLSLTESWHRPHRGRPNAPLRAPEQDGAVRSGTFRSASPGALAGVARQGGGVNGIPLGEGEIKPPLFAHGVALHRENPKKPLKNLLRLKKIVHQSDKIRGQYTTDKYTLS